MNKKYIFFVMFLMISMSGCQGELENLQLDDLNKSETIILNRFITLERARSVAINDSLTGFALLDSINIAWGDSSLSETIALLPDNPARLSAFHKLLVKVLDCERDSLVLAPIAARLKHPLPNPDVDQKP